MNKKIIIIIIILFFTRIFIGCNYNETIILENNKFDMINKPLIEFKVNRMDYQYSSREEIVDIGYFRGNVYIAKADAVQKEISNIFGNYNSKNTLEESLFILNTDGSVKKSELIIPAQYTVDYQSKSFSRILFSETGMINWQTGEEKEIITADIANKILVNKDAQGKFEKKLGFIIGSDSHLALVCNDEKDGQIIVVDLDNSNYKATNIIPYDYANKDINIFYDRATSKNYIVQSNGSIIGLNEENGILTTSLHDKIELEENNVIKKLTSRDGNIYFEVGPKVDSSYYKQDIFFRYDVKKKEKVEVYKNSLDTNLELIESENGYGIISSRKSVNGVEEANNLNTIELYKYHLAKFDGDKVHIIKSIGEDIMDQSLDPKVYINESEDIVLVSSKINKGVVVKYQLFELN